jgi:hypothetical protein
VSLVDEGGLEQAREQLQEFVAGVFAGLKRPATGKATSAR